EKIVEARNLLLTKADVKQTYIEEFAIRSGEKSYLGATVNFPLITGKSNYYKCFISRGFDLGSKRGVIGFLHPESVYDDPNGGQFRVEMFYRLFYHFQFLNELLLFAEVDHHTKFSINIYQSRR